MDDPKMYSIRIDRPDGTYHECSSPSWAECVELSGIVQEFTVDVADEVANITIASSLLGKKFYRGPRTRGGYGDPGC